jgi:acetate---CoA ligase (ADP-forming)
MDLSRLLAPRSVAVVGASTRPGSYGNLAVANLVEAQFDGPVYGVHPTSTELYGVPCFPTLSDLPEAPDAVVIATPARTVPGIVDEAGRLGCGGAVVFAAGFAEVAHGRALQDELRENALRHQLPVAGPNGNGLISLRNRAPLWGDGYHLSEAGPVALISQSGNVSVNALGTRRGLHLHTVVSCGNQAVLEAADYLAAFADLEGVRSVACYLEADGNGAQLADALAACAERGIGVAVLKSGRTALGATSAAAHTGSVASDARVLQALVEEAGAVWVDDPHDLLETAKALAVGRRTRGGVAIVTCSGGDAAVSADVAVGLGTDLPPLHETTAHRLHDLLPDAATIGNPLDYTAVIWGDIPLIGSIVATTGDDPGIGQVLAYYDEPQDMDDASTQSWGDTLTGIAEGARRTGAGVTVCSTLPDLLPEASIERLQSQGVPAVWGLRTGLVVCHALSTPPGDPARLRELAKAAAAVGPPSHWLAEHEAKQLLGEHGVTVPHGRVVDDAATAAAVAEELGWPVVLKLSDPDLQHKSDIGALEVGLVDDEAVRRAFSRLRSIPGHHQTPVLVERMADAGVEVMVAAHRDGVVPALVIALGGVWVELMGDSVVLPLPATAEQVRDALGALRAAPLLLGGRGRQGVDVASLAQLAAGVGRLLLDERLQLIELNPVLVSAGGAVAVDAVIRTTQS